MEIYLPRSARQHWVYTRHETSSQRMETEAPITMVMSIGDQNNSVKKRTAEKEAARYSSLLPTLPLSQLLQLDIAVLDFMSFVEYGDGLCLPAEVGVARGRLGSLLLEDCQGFGCIPNIPYRDQRTGFAWEAKDTCDRVHGIDLFEDRASKSDLQTLCNEMMGKLEGCTLLLCRSEDLNRVVGCWYWLQDNRAVHNLPNIRVMLIEDFLVETLTRLHQISEVSEGGVPTFSQFTTLLTRSANDLNQQFRCEYHNTVEKAWDKAGCAKKNAMKYLGTISECLNPAIAECKLRQGPPVTPPPVILPVAAARAEAPAQKTRADNQSALSDERNSPRPCSREGSVYSTGSSSSSCYSTAESHLPGTNSQTSLNSSTKRRGRGRGSHTSSIASSNSTETRKKHNPLGLLTPNDFLVPETPSNCSEDSVSLRSGSPYSSTPGVSVSPDLPAPVAEAAPPRAEPDSFSTSASSSLILAPGTEQDCSVSEQDSVPAPPRRPGSSYSARKSCASSYKKEGLSLPSSGVTNLPLRGSPAPAGHTQIGSTPEKETRIPRKPRSLNNKGKGEEKDRTAYDTNINKDPPVQLKEEKESVTGSPGKNRGRVPRSGHSTVPSDTVLVPTSVTSDTVLVPTSASKAAPASTPAASTPPATVAGPASTAATSASSRREASPEFLSDENDNSEAIDAALALASAVQSAENLLRESPAPPHPAFLLAFSTAESTSQITPPPGFDPVPKHRDIPAGFVVAPLPGSTVRARGELNESFSSEDSGNQGVKPAKKRGRNVQR